MKELSDKWAYSSMNDEKETAIPERTVYRVSHTVESVLRAELLLSRITMLPDTIHAPEEYFVSETIFGSIVQLLRAVKHTNLWLRELLVNLRYKSSEINIRNRHIRTT